MAKRRSIEPELLTHPTFRRASLVARELWLGMILQADDEGRLRVDAVALGETVFSPLTHKINAAKIAEAVDFWATTHENGKQPWLLLYGDGYGFLTGWFEHQYIKACDREQSSLPPPPVPVDSWAAADAVYHWYCRTHKQAKTYYRLPMRALSQLTVEEQYGVVTEELRNSTVTVTPRREGKGREGSVLAQPEQLPAQPDPEPGTPTYPPADYSHMALGNYPEIPQAIAAAQPKWPVPKVQQFALDCIAAVEDDNTPVELDELLGWLAAEGTKPSIVDRGDTWLRRMLGQRGAQQRAAATTSPAAANDPALAECIRLHGPCPEDQFDLADWGQKLKALRAQYAAAGAAQ